AHDTDKLPPVEDGQVSDVVPPHRHQRFEESHLPRDGVRGRGHPAIDLVGGLHLEISFAWAYFDMFTLFDPERTLRMRRASVAVKIPITRARSTTTAEPTCRSAIVAATSASGVSGATT